MWKVRRFSRALLVLLFVMAGARQAAAAGFVSPFFGYNFGGSSGCPEITNCSDKRLDWGVSLGAVGSLLGFETEFGYTKNFFGETAGQTSDVFTWTANLMLAPKIGPVQPYGVIGLGVIHTGVEATAASSGSDSNDFAWVGGGGLMVFFSNHFGVRGDVRYFRSFEVVDFSKFPSLPIRNEKLDFGRAAGAVVFKF